MPPGPLHWNWKLKLALLLLGFGLFVNTIFSPRPASNPRGPKGGHLLSDGDSAVAQCDSKFGTQVVQTATSPSFKMAVAGYPADMVSQWLGDFGLWDVHVLGVISHALARAPPGDDEVMVDAGANLGFFGLFAAHSGFPAVAFEMQPRLHRVINTSLCLAELAAEDSKFPYRLVPRPISDVEIELLVAEPQNSSTNLGGLGLEAFSCDPNDGGTVDLTGCTKTKTVRIDAIIKAPTKIRIIKVDVEGLEWPVIKSLLGLLDRGLIETIILEVTPHVHGVAHAVPMLKKLAASGMTLLEVPFEYVAPGKVYPELTLEPIDPNIDAFVLKLLMRKDLRELGQAEIVATKIPDYFRRIPARDI